jgi:hypothetical protein
VTLLLHGQKEGERRGAEAGQARDERKLALAQGEEREPHDLLPVHLLRFKRAEPGGTRHTAHGTRVKVNTWESCERRSSLGQRATYKCLCERISLSAMGTLSMRSVPLPTSSCSLCVCVCRVCGVVCVSYTCGAVGRVLMWWRTTYPA